MQDARTAPRVILQYNCIPHYRARVFELLSQRDDVHFTVVADRNPDTPYLKTVQGGDACAIRSVEARTHLIRIPGFAHLYWQPRVLRMVLRERPDAVIALGTPYSLTAWALLAAGKLLRIPVLLWGHGLLGDESGPKWWLRRALYRLAAGQLLYGEHARDLLQRKGFPERSLYVVYNSLNFDEQRRVAERLSRQGTDDFRRGLGVGPGEGLVVFVGRIQPLKRLDMLIEAAGMLARRGQRVHLALVGDGGARAELERFAVSAGAADLTHFLGETYDEEFIGTVIDAADLAVVPSYAGLTVVHALAFGTPVVLNDRLEEHGPEWEAVIEGKTGFFYRYGDVGDLSEKISQAIFPVRAKGRMSEACRAIVRDKYNPHRQVETFVRAVCETARVCGGENEPAA